MLAPTFPIISFVGIPMPGNLHLLSINAPPRPFSQVFELVQLPGGEGLWGDAGFAPRLPQGRADRTRWDRGECWGGAKPPKK